jgi:hypothetical protein
MPLAGIPRNATGLVFGKEAQESLGAMAYIVGTGIHFFFAASNRLTWHRARRGPHRWSVEGETTPHPSFTCISTWRRPAFAKTSRT